MTEPRPTPLFNSSMPKHNLPWFALVMLLLTGWLVYSLAPILTPFLAGALLAYMFNPLATRFERMGLSRIMATLAVITLVGLALVGLVLIALPLFQGQFSELAARLPGTLDSARTHVLPWLEQHFGLRINLDLEVIKTWLAEKAKQNGADWLPTLKTGAMAVMGILANLLLIPVVMFY